MSEINETPVDIAAVKKPFNKKKAIISSVVAGALVIAGVVGVTAFKAKPEIRLVTALSNLFGDKNVEMGFSVQMTPEFMNAMGMTDADVASMGRPGIANVSDAATALGLMELRISNLDESSTDEKLSSRVQLAYGSKSVIDLTLIDRVLYLSTDAMTLPEQSPQLITQSEVDGVMSALSMYASLAPQLSDAINALTSGAPVSVNFEKGTTLGDAFDEYIKSTEESALSSKFLDDFKDANGTALRNSATVLSKGSDETGDIFILSIDLSKYVSEMKTPIKKLIKENLSVFGTTPTDADLDTAVKELKGKSLDIKTWLDGDNLVRLEIDLTQFVASDKNLNAWSAAIRMNIGDANIVKPADAYDITEDLLALGLI
jgi:hypothetical protein